MAKRKKLKMSKIPSDPKSYYDEAIPSAPKAVRQFYTALTLQNAALLRSVLTNDFSFKSPAASFETPDQFIGMVGVFGGWVESDKIIVSGNDVVNLFTYHMTEPVQTDIPMCDIFTLEDGKISSTITYNNPADFPG